MLKKINPYFFLIIFFYSFNVFSKQIKILNNLTGNGLEIINHSKIQVHYIGYLEDGTEFDNSYKRGSPLQFQIGNGQVIEGWEIGLLGMKKGGKRTLIIPPNLAYGERGAGNLIPPNATLNFDIEILDVVAPGYKLIDSDQLLLAMTGNFKIIDIRTKDKVLTTGIIPGSINLPAFNKSGKFVNDFFESYEKIVNINDKVLFVSDNGTISSILANGFVERLGRSNIYSLKKGIQGLIEKDFELIKN